MEWPTPKNVNEVRSFMGLEGHYRRFIRNLSKIGHPITSLQRKGKKFKWKIKCATKFEQLKQLLTNAPVLRITNPNKYFLVCTNACKERIDGVLM